MMYLLQHDGFEKKHSWFVEEVQVLNMSTHECWVFPYHQWLSLYFGPKLSVKINIRAQRTEIEEKGDDNANILFCVVDANQNTHFPDGITR